MTPSPATVAPREEIAIRLWSERPRLEQVMVDQIEALAPVLATLSTAQLRGLVNAIAPGPERRTVAERRQSLAYFLAWRHHRAQKRSDGDSDRAAVASLWGGVADQVTAALTLLETECQALFAELQARQQAYWAQHTALITAYREEFTLAQMEEFLYRLIRHVTSSQADAPLPTSTPNALKGDAP